MTRRGSRETLRRRILLGRMRCQAVLARSGPIHKLEDDVLAHDVDMVVSPLLERVCRYEAAAFPWRTDVATPAGMRLDLVGRSVGDVNTAAVGLPALCNR